MKTPCLEWSQYRNPHGYGTVRRNGKMILAHREVYRLVYGKFDEQLEVCHSCDNPGCVNPFHLFLGTRQDNMSDMKYKNRAQRGEAHVRSKLTQQQVEQIKQDTRPVKEMLDDYPVSAQQLYKIRGKKQWRVYDQTKRGEEEDSGSVQE